MASETYRDLHTSEYIAQIKFKSEQYKIFTLRTDLSAPVEEHPRNFNFKDLDEFLDEPFH